MANMSYVRFENTVRDLMDCHRHINDDDLSEREDSSRKVLVSICRDIIEAYDRENPEEE
jgi:hypothetical protein